jgi:hypothetical protein
MPRVVTPGGGTLAFETVPVTTGETHQVKSDIEFVRVNRSHRAIHDYTKTLDNSNKKKNDSLTSPRALRRNHERACPRRFEAVLIPSFCPRPYTRHGGALDGVRRSVRSNLIQCARMRNDTRIGVRISHIRALCEAYIEAECGSVPVFCHALGGDFPERSSVYGLGKYTGEAQQTAR